MKHLTKYEEYLKRKKAEYGRRFDASCLDARFVPAFNDGERIRVRIHGETMTGTVGVTTGWRPVFLLMRSSRHRGSCETLGASHELLPPVKPATICSFCEAPIQWKHYAGHLEKVHPGGRAAPRPMPTKSMADLLIEGAKDGTLLVEWE